MRRHEAEVGWLCGVPPPGKTVSAELLAPGLIIGAAFESAYPVAKGNYYDIEARMATHRCTMHMHNAHAHAHVMLHAHAHAHVMLHAHAHAHVMLHAHAHAHMACACT